MSRAARALVASWAVAACSAPEPLPQALVVIDTDAPAPALFDRLQITVLGADGQPLCAVGCDHERALDAQTPWPLSFGIGAPSNPDTVVYVRATLLAGGRVATGALRAATTIDRIARVRFAPRAVVTQALFLPFACVGDAADPTAPSSCDAAGMPDAPVATMPAGDASAPSLVGSWPPPTLRRACGGAPTIDHAAVHDGEACIAGGAFWLGSELVRSAGPDDAVPERPVAVSAFYLDQYEYTVGRYRARLAAGFVPDRGPLVWHDAFVQPDHVNSPCGATPTLCATYRAPDDATNDAQPLDGVPRALAAQLCAAEGRRLPTEAEWEWAAGGREAEQRYPWGDDPPGCGDLAGLYATPPPLAPTRACTPGNNPDARAPGPVGSHPLDRTGDGVFDLGGSVAEWVADVLLPYTDPCWLRARGAIDPRCDPPPDPPDDTVYAVRGGNWIVPLPQAWFAAGRAGATDAPPPSPAMGFRCARDAP